MCLPCPWLGCLAAGTGGKASVLDPEVEIPVISSALGSRQRFRYHMQAGMLHPAETEYAFKAASSGGSVQCRI